MKHILTLTILCLFSFQLFSQVECADQIAFEQNLPYSDNVVSDRYTNLSGSTTEVPEAFSQLVFEDFILDDLTDINTICFPGSFNYYDDLNRGEVSSRNGECDPETRTFEVIYYNDYPAFPTNYTNNIFAGPFNFTPTTVVPYNATPYYQFTGMHDVVSFALNTSYWVSIQNIDNDGCEFRLQVNGNEVLQPDRNTINTRESDGLFWVINQEGEFDNMGCINFALGATGLAPIPTLSQWGIILLGLLVIVFGVVYVKNEQKVMAV